MSALRGLSMVAVVALAAAGGFFAARHLDGLRPPAGEVAIGDDVREPLYWVAPMDPAYRSDQPGKSPMGMDLVPVYADQAGAGAAPHTALRIDPRVINNIGVQIAAVARGTLSRPVKTVGYVVPDAERVAHVHVRARGWIERLVADTEGARVRRGDLLFEIYSPALVSAEHEYLQALGIGQPGLVEAGAERLRALGMLPAQVEALRKSREVRHRFGVHASQDGFVMDLNVREGMFVEPGTTIMALADLTTVWVEVDLFEQQIGWVRCGQSARMRLAFAPTREWRGTVDYVYPTIRPESRTARVRLVFENDDLALKPAMYADVEIDVEPRADVLSVPDAAVIRSGPTARVILAEAGGRFRPAEVETGLESAGRVEIVRGLAAGERVVVSGQFLIDSEASLDASLLRMLGPQPGGDAMPDHAAMGQPAPPVDPAPPAADHAAGHVHD